MTYIIEEHADAHNNIIEVYRMVDLPNFIHLDSPHLHWEQESVLRFHYQPFVHLVSNQFFEPGTFLLITGPTL